MKLPNYLCFALPLAVFACASCAGGGGGGGIVNVTYPFTRALSYKANNLDTSRNINIYVEPETADPDNFYPIFTSKIATTEAKYTWTTPATTVDVTFVLEFEGQVQARRTITISGEEMRTYIRENSRPEVIWNRTTFTVRK